MNKTLIGGVAATAVALGITGAVTASPAQAINQQDVQFIQLLDSHGITANGLRTQWGHGICTDLTNHYSVGWTQVDAFHYAVNSVYHNTAANFTANDSMWFVASAVTVYCPWYDPTGGSTGGTTGGTTV